MRSELTKQNDNYISKHRYLELYHHCLQYHEWKEEIRNMNLLSDTTDNAAIRIKSLNDKIDILKQTADETDCSISSYLLKGVTEKRSYDNLKLRFDIPCGRSYYYQRYREFFHRLSLKS